MIRGWHWVVLLPAFLAVPLYAQPAPAAPASQQTSRSESNPTLDRAEALLKAGQWKAAHDLIVPWLKANPKAPDRDRGLFLLAEVYYQNGDRVRAFYHCDELMDNYPESRLFFPALQLQYDIADAYLNGFKDTFLGMRVVPMTEEAVEMLYRIQERSPGSPLAEKALKRTADYYFNTSQFDLAAAAYGAFARSYPRSPDVPQARLRQAFSSLAQFRGPRYDATPLIDARAQFREIQARYPELAADMNLAGWIDRIDADLARKAYISGDFYARTNQPKGAAYMYRYIIETYPNSHEATLARAALAKLPASALTGPPPPPSNPEAAATQPAGAGGTPPGESERRP
jgi:outer membrane assembly lipoprotein YfiO